MKGLLGVVIVIFAVVLYQIVVGIVATDVFVGESEGVENDKG